MEGLTEGRIVHYVLKNNEHRPAIVVRDWSNSTLCSYPDGTVNMIVFLDGSNDGFTGIVRANLDTALMSWRTSVHYSETKEPGTWHWIEKA